MCIIYTLVYYDLLTPCTKAVVVALLSFLLPPINADVDAAAAITGPSSEH